MVNLVIMVYVITDVIVLLMLPTMKDARTLAEEVEAVEAEVTDVMDLVVVIVIVNQI